MRLSVCMFDSEVEAGLTAKFARLLPHLNERQRRLAAAEAINEELEHLTVKVISGRALSGR